MTHTYEVSYLW